MAKRSTLSPPPDDPRPTWRWYIVYEDTFDRESSPSTDLEGVGLVPALAELWARFLLETVQTTATHREGQVEEVPSRGFSEFTLFGESLRLSLEGSLAGALRLKKWLYPHPLREVIGDETRFLRELAAAHASAGSIEDAALVILDAAESADSRDAFETIVRQLRST